MNRILLLVSVALLSSCGNNQDAFDFAQDHVWGDKVNGCSYVKIRFFPNHIEFTRSDKMIKNLYKFVEPQLVGKDELKKIHKEIIQKYEFNIVENNEKYFIASYEHGKYSEVGQYKVKFVRNYDEIYLAGFYNGSWKYYKRNNDIYPTDYIMCD